MRIIYLIILSVMSYVGAARAAPLDIIRQQVPYSVPHYLKWGGLFLKLQVHYFKPLFLAIIGVVFLVELIHFLSVGPKKFKEEKFVKVFNVFNIVIHWIAALSFIILVPTGLIIVFGKFFGGGSFVRAMRYLHVIGAVLFLISVAPLFFMWIVNMLPEKGDLEWISKGGGYLTKQNIETGAGKFNPGQKLWFWIVVIFGAVMLFSGFIMYLREPSFTVHFFRYQIDFLRFVAIVHNFSAMILIAMFMIHLYMSLFVVKGSLKSMFTGYKSEEELKYLHSSFYKELERRNKI